MRVLQGRIQELAGLFWIEALDQLGGALEVGKEHRYLLALAFQGAREARIFSARYDGVYGSGARSWSLTSAGGIAASPVQTSTAPASSTASFLAWMISALRSSR
jgi:hypothetical protein